MTEDKLKIAIEALKDITQGVGVYSRDQLTHASNTIDAMKALAQSALDKIDG